MNLFTGKKNEAAQATQQGQQGQGQNVVRVSQPLAGQHQPSQADYLDRNQLLPSNPQMSAMPPGFAQPQQQQQGLQDFNSMYQQNEPMAANDGGAGSGDLGRG